MLLSVYKYFPPENDPVAYAIPFFLLLIGIEIYLSYKENKERYVAKDALASIGMGLGSVAINTLMKGIAFGVFSIIYEYRLFEIGWQWWAWMLVFFADDFTFYWHHRLSHEVAYSMVSSYKSSFISKIYFGNSIASELGRIVL
jgi:sterol desaturase/sphingolipid hydroxylase (fatty acid hydroxylase superfamily)